MIRSGIVAFCGSKGAGKSTASEIFTEILETAGVQVEEKALAERLKLICAEVSECDIKWFLDPNLKEKDLPAFISLNQENVTRIWEDFGVMGESLDYDRLVRPHIGMIFHTGRKLLQYVGTELLQSYEKTISVADAMRNINRDAITIINDFRFHHEKDYLQKLDDFYPVYVKNSRAEDAAAGDSHPSERQFHDFKSECHLIENEGTLSDLRTNVLSFVQETFFKSST